MALSSGLPSGNRWHISVERDYTVVTIVWCGLHEARSPCSSETGKTEAFVDFINLALGGFLILSPWLLGFKSQLGWHTSWMAGAAIGVVAIFSIADLF